MDRGDMLQIKEESGDTEVDVGPTILQHMDSHYRTNQELANSVTSISSCSADAITVIQESATDNNNVDTVLNNAYKQESNEMELTGVDAQWCAQAISTTAGAGSVKQDINITVEGRNLVIEPTVLQYRANQNTSVVKTENTITYDGSDPKLCHIVKEESVENKCRVTTGAHFYNNVIPSKERVCSVLYSCDKCVQTFTSNDIFRQHYRLAHSIEPHEHQCEIQIEINEEFKLKSYFRVQIAHCGLPQYECTVCKKIYKSKQCLRDHVLADHLTKPKEPDIYICDYCQRTFPNKNSFRTHIMWHLRPFKCNRCGRSYRVTHNCKHDPKQCNVCGISMKAVNLRYHVQRMHGGEQLRCMLCGKAVKSKYYYQQHMNEHLRQPSASKLGAKSNFHDQQSSGTCGTSNGMQQDMQTASKESSITSDGNIDLTASPDAHLLNRCSYCNNIYSFTKNLNDHVRNKHGFYRCSKCSRDFKSNDMLLKHKKSLHQEENPALPVPVNRCVFCQKIYRTKQYLSLHIRNVHGKGFRVCSECKVGFESEDQLQGHIKLMHSKEDHEERNMGEESNASTQQQDVVVMKEESTDGDELELGPVVLQHIDCNYRPYKEEPQLD